MISIPTILEHRSASLNSKAMQVQLLRTLR